MGQTLELSAMDLALLDFELRFCVLCNRHWFNRVPGPDTDLGVACLPFTLAQTLAMSIYP